ncbi:MAG TPA: addiction module protein [Gemmata sp.]|jgi:putative addiction module component (TIGR02574 family)|nr:addiction module protein [Gemmata sp.]
MSITLEALGINSMSVDERIALIQEIWDSLEAVQEQVLLTEAQKAELDRRVAAHQENPAAVIPWEQIKTEALGRFPE